METKKMIKKVAKNISQYRTNKKKSIAHNNYMIDVCECVCTRAIHMRYIRTKYHTCPTRDRLGTEVTHKKKQW